eukprot:gene31805-38448_t
MTVGKSQSPDVLCPATSGKDLRETEKIFTAALLPPLYLVAGYLKWMKDRKEFEIKPYIFTYNLYQCILNDGRGTSYSEEACLSSTLYSADKALYSSVSSSLSSRISYRCSCIESFFVWFAISFTPASFASTSLFLTPSCDSSRAVIPWTAAAPTFDSLKDFFPVWSCHPAVFPQLQPGKAFSYLDTNRMPGRTTPSSAERTCHGTCPEIPSSSQLSRLAQQ